MVLRHSAETVGCAFTEQYYQVLYHRPEDTHKFYKDSSVAGWEGKDGVVRSVTTMKGINDMIMSSDYKDSDVEVKGVYAQDSLQGSILLVVTGSLTGKDDVIRTFSHTFLLARQERGFFVLNDIFRFLDIHPSTPEAANGSILNASESPSSSNSGLSELVEDSEKTCTKPDAEVTKSEPKRNPSHEENQEIISESLKSPQPAAVSPTKDTAPKTTYLEKLSKENKCPQTHTVQIVRVSASDGSLIETKTDVPTVNEPIKKTSLQPSSVVSKPASPPSDETFENIYQRSTETASLLPSRAMGIYIGGLPPNTTKNELTEAVKIFGRVRKNDGVQVIDNRNEDGFTYAFVHFETEESVHKAIEAHNITIRGKEAYITYKKSNARGSNGNGRAQTGGDWAHRNPSSGRGGGSYNNGYWDGGEDGAFYEYEYYHRNRSSDGRDRDSYQWNGGGGGRRRGIRGGY